MKRHVLEISGAILLGVVVYLSYSVASFLLPPLSLFGSSAETFYDLAPEPIWLCRWQLSSPRFPQFCLGLCTKEEFQQ